MIPYGTSMCNNDIHTACHCQVDRFKFVTSGKYKTGICERYSKNRTDDLHMAWFNGDAYVPW